MYKPIVKYTRSISPYSGVLEFYPDDIKKIANNGECVFKGLHGDQFMAITTIPGSSSDKPGGYRVCIYDPSNGITPDVIIAQLDIRPDEPFVYCFKRKTSSVELHVIHAPRMLKSLVAWALGGTLKQGKASMSELRAHYDMLLTAYVEKERTDPYTPQRFCHGKFEAVVNYFEDGMPDRNNSVYFIDGWPTRDEALKALEKAKQLDGWYFSSVAKINYAINLISKASGVHNITVEEEKQ